MRQSIRAGVIGCGDVARKAHLPVYASRTDVELVAVADLDPERRRRAMIDFGAERSYEDGVSLLEDETVDAVSICTPVTTHESLFVTAAASTDAIFCVKPFAETLESARVMADAAAEHDVITQIGYMYRFTGNFQRVLSMWRNHVLGRLRTLHTEFHSLAPDMEWYYEKDFPGGGVVKRIFCHYLDFYLELFGDAPIVTRADVSSVRTRDIEDFAEVGLQFGDTSVTATVGDLQQDSAIHQNHAVGNDAALTFNVRDFRGNVNGARVFYKFGHLPRVNVGFWQYWGSVSDDYHTARIHDFVDHVLRGDRDTAAPVTRGVEVTRITEKIYEKAGVL